MFLFYSFPLCQHTYLSAAGKVCCTFSKPSYDQKIHKHTQSLFPPTHYPHHPRRMSNSTYMFR